MARNPTYVIPPGHTKDEPAVGPTRNYHVTPQRAGSYLDILQKSQPDLKFHTNGGDNESGVQFGQPGIFNGNRWGYDTVRQGPFTEGWQKGTIKLKGRDSAHRHISGAVADASKDDLKALHGQNMRDGDDNTMAVTDSYGNIAVFGRPSALLKRGFSEQDFMEHEYEGVFQESLPGYKGSQIMKVVVPHR